MNGKINQNRKPRKKKLKLPGYACDLTRPLLFENCDQRLQALAVSAKGRNNFQECWDLKCIVGYPVPGSRMVEKWAKSSERTVFRSLAFSALACFFRSSTLTEILEQANCGKDTTHKSVMITVKQFLSRHSLVVRFAWVRQDYKLFLRCR